VRNLGSSIGISIMAALLTRNLATSHASLVTHITPTNQNLLSAGIDASTFATAAGQQSAAIVDGMVTLQAAMIAYLDDFKLMFWITLAAVPLLLILRRRPASAPAGAMAQQAVMAD
jgi:DHA2 family multidrug resistance protein